MGNPFSEVYFDVAAKRYEFKLGTFALAALERRVKMPATAFFRRPDDQWGADDVLAVFTAGLQRAHKLSEEEAADLIDALGIERVQEIILEAVGSANGRRVEGDSANPPTAAVNGIGTSS